MFLQVVALLILAALILLVVAVFFVALQLKKPDVAPPGPAPQPPGPPPSVTTAGTVVVAAGHFDKSGQSGPPPLFSFNANVSPLGVGAYLLRFTGFSSGENYLVKVTAVSDAAGAGGPHFVEVRQIRDDGIVLGVSRQDGTPAANGFMVEVSRY